MVNRSPRLSLTAKQLETAVGVDLLALCQRVTADGCFTPDEAKELGRWLEENASIYLPSIGYLRSTVQRILADGLITPDELRELHQAVERIMPPEYRIVSQAIRKDLEHAEEIRQRPLARIDSMVAGVTFEGRAYVVHQHASPGDRVFLVRDRNNQYSKAAIEVRLANGMQIGYVPDEEAQLVAPFLDRGAVQLASIKKIWSGRRVDVPIMEALLYASDCGVEGCFAEKDCPVKVEIPASYLTLAEMVMRDTSTESVSALDKSVRTKQGCVTVCTVLTLGIVIFLIGLAARI